MFFENGMNIVAELPKKGSGITGEIFVEFEPNGHPCH